MNYAQKKDYEERMLKGAREILEMPQVKEFQLNGWYDVDVKRDEYPNELEMYLIRKSASNDLYTEIHLRIRHLDGDVENIGTYSKKYGCEIFQSFCPQPHDVQSSEV